MSNSTIKSQIERIQARLDLYNDALDALIIGGVQSYTLDTGQSKQTVTKMDIDKLEERREKLINELNMLSARLTGSNVSIGRPSW